MKYRTVKTWRAAMRVMSLILFSTDVRRHRVQACEACLAGQDCPTIQDIMRHAGILPGWKRE